MPIVRASDKARRPPPEPKPRRRLPWRGIGLGLAVLLLGLAVATGLWAWPWIAGPPSDDAAIEADWSQVVAWSGSRPETGAPSELLELALASLADERGLAEAAWDEQDPTLLEPLPDALADALGAFERWRSEGGGLGPDPCAGGLRPTLRAVDLLTLARLALLTAEGGSDPRFEAVLRLGWALRDRGGLLQHTAGIVLAVEALDRAEVLEQRPAALARWRPTLDELFGALARDAVCFHDGAAELLPSGGMGSLPDADRRSGLRSVERELQMLRWWKGHRIVAARRHRHDPAALADALDPGDADRLPRSALVRLGTLNARGLIERTADAVGRYEALPGR